MVLLYITFKMENFELCDVYPNIFSQMRFDVIPLMLTNKYFHTQVRIFANTIDIDFDVLRSIPSIDINEYIANIFKIPITYHDLVTGVSLQLWDYILENTHLLRWTLKSIPRISVPYRATISNVADIIATRPVQVDLLGQKVRGINVVVTANNVAKYPALSCNKYCFESIGKLLIENPDRIVQYTSKLNVVDSLLLAKITFDTLGLPLDVAKHGKINQRYSVIAYMVDMKKAYVAGYKFNPTFTCGVRRLKSVCEFLPTLDDYSDICVSLLMLLIIIKDPSIITQKNTQLMPFIEALLSITHPNTVPMLSPNQDIARQIFMYCFDKNAYGHFIIKRSSLNSHIVVGKISKTHKRFIEKYAENIMKKLA